MLPSFEWGFHPAKIEGDGSRSIEAIQAKNEQ